MPEPVHQWWARRQWSKSTDVPYPIGTFRADWERYPVLVRQYHPDLNRGVTLTQVPPVADVWLLWQCDTGHRFIATPAEQRQRPSGERRRSSWCPECSAQAAPRPVPPPPAPPLPLESASSFAPALPSAPRRSAVKPPSTRSRRTRPATGEPRMPDATHAVGDAFVSARAPKPASRAEAELRALLRERFELDFETNAVRVARPFFDRLEVWPDLLFPELRVAVEYDTTGRHGLEHVGRREVVDRRKDSLLRQAGWEVIRIRCGHLQALGPFDLLAGGVSQTLVDRLVDRLRELRGPFLVNAYLRNPHR